MAAKSRVWEQKPSKQRRLTPNDLDREPKDKKDKRRASTGGGERKPSHAVPCGPKKRFTRQKKSCEQKIQGAVGMEDAVKDHQAHTDGSIKKLQTGDAKKESQKTVEKIQKKPERKRTHPLLKKQPKARKGCYQNKQKSPKIKGTIKKTTS